MSADQPDPGFLAQIKRFFPELEITWQVLLVMILAPVVLVLACTLCGYWNTLGIDVFSYLTFGSLLLDGFFGSVTVLSSLAAGFVMLTLTSLVFFNEGGEQPLRNLKWKILMFISLHGVCSAIILRHCGITPLSISALVVVLVLAGVGGKGASEDLESRGLALWCWLILPAAIGIPLLGYVHGAKRAEDYLRTPLAQALQGGDPGWGQLSVLGPLGTSSRRFFPEPYVPVVEVQTAGFNLEKNYFLGRIGDHFFFLDPATLKREAIAEKDITRFTLVNNATRSTFVLPFWKEKTSGP